VSVTFRFGKHKGNSVEWVFFHDPGYIWWLTHKKADLRGPLGIRFDHPSFYTPDYFRGYDKTGAKILISEVKHAYFGSGSARLTQKRMEEFFNNPANFVSF
jgi:hypothetical protein